MGLLNKEGDKENRNFSDQRDEEIRLRRMIEESVDDSVNRAFKKYGKSYSGRGRLGKTAGIILLAVIVIGGFFWWQSRHNIEVAQLADHDLTLENNGIFGYTAVDFEDVILGEATRQKLLIVEEQEASVNTTSTDTGFMNWKIFSKQQILTIHGTGQYTIDISQISADDISLDEESYELTIVIPHAELHNTTFNPSETEIGDTKRGWLAFGDISLTAEQNKEFETKAVSLLKEELSKEECLEEADRFAKLSAYETYQPLVDTISTAYKVIIEFADETAENATDAS